MHFHVKKLIEKFLHTLPRLNSPTDSYHNPQAEGNYSFSYKQCFLEIYSPKEREGAMFLETEFMPVRDPLCWFLGSHLALLSLTLG